MDSVPNISPNELERLTDQDKAELRQFIGNETQRAKIQTQTHSMTEICWTKCIPASSKGNKLDSSEQSCLANCVDRFLDLNLATLKHLSSLRN
ncbi:Tim10/DDP family zinc finger-domain-containing protein [Lasiosphaeria hispida]|uniref:Mitochondrial import inner membrane translocase subunit n=1 Tax=Lasiosphaeria hispida TaxID=260671 RepID=A0AAJ0HM75_9PEZI|nr:Tim10/DDP family zinc finger-domain-containing protein [Lasiosphaeria hispida]